MFFLNNYRRIKIKTKITLLLLVLLAGLNIACVSTGLTVATHLYRNSDIVVDLYNKITTDNVFEGDKEEETQIVFRQHSHRPKEKKAKKQTKPKVVYVTAKPSYQGANNVVAGNVIQNFQDQEYEERQRYLKERRIAYEKKLAESRRKLYGK